MKAEAKSSEVLSQQLRPLEANKLIHFCHSLPPNVPGAVKGYLELIIQKISWKTIKVYTDVEIQVHWWGQKEEKNRRIQVNTNRKLISQMPLRTLYYQINTNFSLFRQYLISSDPINLDIYSTKTNQYIGCSQIETREFLSHNGGQRCILVSPISGCRKLVLGEVTVILNMQMLESLLGPIHLKDVKPIIMKEKKLNKENIAVIGKKKKVSIRDPKPRKLSTLVKTSSSEKKSFTIQDNVQKEVSIGVAVSSSIYDNNNSSRKSSIDIKPKTSVLRYFSGQSISTSRDDAFNLPEDLVTISPSQSNKESREAPENIDFMRITVSQVEFNAAGLLETQNFINKNLHQKCFLKCVVTSKMFKSGEDIKIISPAFETTLKSKYISI